MTVPDGTSSTSSGTGVSCSGWFRSAGSASFRVIAIALRRWEIHREHCRF
jgi:hypothetical protein